MTAFPVWFAGKADITGGTVVASVSNDVELIAHEAEVSPGHWKLFPYTAANKASQLAAANAYVGSSDPKAQATTPGNPVTGAIKAATGGILGLPALSNLRDLVIRSVKVILGGALIIIGLAKLSGVDKIASNLPKVIPV